MNKLNRIVCFVGLICACLYGLSSSLYTPESTLGRVKEITELLGSRQVVAIVCIVCGALSAIAVYLVVRAAHSQPAIVRFGLRLFVFMLLGIGAGIIVALALVYVGVCRTAQSVAFLSLNATMVLAGGAAGVVAMHSV